MIREKSILFTAPFSMSVVLGLVTLAVPLLAVNLGASALTLGGLGFVSTLCYVVLTPIFGKIVDSIGYKFVLTLGTVSYFLSSFALSLSTQIYQLFIFMPFVGIAGAMFWPAFEVWLTRMETNSPLLKKVSFFNVSWCLGSGIGPLIAGKLFEIHSHLPLYFAGLLALIITILIGQKLYRGRQGNYLKNSKKGTEVNENFSSSSSRRKAPLYLYIGWIANFANYFCIGILRYLFPKLSVEIGIKPSLIGVLLFTVAFFQLATFYLLGQTERWHYKGIPLVIFQLFIVIGLIVTFFSNSVISFLLAFMFIGVGGGMVYFSSIFYSLDSIEGTGQKSGIHEAVLGIGLLLGPLTGGAIAEVYTLRFPYLLAVMVIGVAILVEILLMRKTV